MRRTLVIECRAQSHAPKVVKVATMVETLDTSGGRVAVDVRYGTRAGSVTVAGPPAPAFEPVNEQLATSAVLDGDRIIDPANAADDADDSGWRVRDRLECRLCGFNLEGRRDRLISAAGPFLQAGVSNVALEALARRLR